MTFTQFSKGPNRQKSQLRGNRIEKASKIFIDLSLYLH